MSPAFSLTDSDAELRRRIESFELDEPRAAFPFSQRLARDNAWSHDYAARVIREYLRFIVLARLAGHPVTPSDPVDQAWHLHLCYTRSYWQALCGEVLGQPLHHHPTQGGAREGSKFADWYARTLDSYRRLFAEEPPPDIWLAPGHHQALRFVRVEQRRGRLESLLRALRERLGGALSLRVGARLGGGALSALILGGCSLVGPLAFWDLRGFEFLGFYVVTWLASAAIGSWIVYDSAGSTAAPARGLDPCELAFLAGGSSRTVDAALGALLVSGAITHERGVFSAHLELDEDESTESFERACYDIVAASGSGGVSRSALEAALDRPLAACKRELCRLGLLADAEAVRLRRLLLWLAPALGVIKLVVGMARARPVGFLFLLLIAAVFAQRRLTRDPQRTAAGSETLKRLAEQHAPLRGFPTRSAASAGLAIALFGSGVLAGTAYAAGFASASAGGGGGGDAGGGGGGDGGCGGCGGCGG